MNLEGRLLGNRYEIIEKIGNGGMATVYKAKCHVLNRFVAVKVLKDEFTTDDEFIKRFNIEAQSVASLTHPNIVSVYDVGNEGNLYYIVMELVKGKTLKEIIVEDGALGWKWSAKIAIQIASALETAHRNNIIHRDIKPHNIIITEDGIAKVADFGIAKAVSNSTVTAFGATIGSVHYFSPEHARGGKTDAKSDLYSLGVVLYEMVTGRVPFDADTPVSVALKHMQEAPIAPIVINPEIPPSINKIIIKAMQKDLNLRYSSATEMIKDLNMAIKNPEGNFVHLTGGEEDFPTQRVVIKNNDTSKETKEKTKKPSKFIQFFNKHTVLKYIAIFLSLVLVFAIATGGTYLALIAGRTKEVQIPNFANMTLEQAQGKAKELKLNVEVFEEKYHLEILEGQIIDQDPKYQNNFKIKEGTTIKLIMSKGQEIITVPQFTGNIKDDALKMIKEIGLEVKFEEENNDEVQKGYIIKQSIEKDEQIPAGTEIILTVSTGIEQVEVPDLSGKTEVEARKAITAAKLTYKATVKTNDTSKPNGVVVNQDVSGGSTVDKNTPITITVNEFNEIKNAIVNVNVKSLTGYIEQKDPEDETKILPPDNVELKVVVDTDTIFKEKVSEASENKSIKVSGIGTVTVKVYVAGILKEQTQLNLNTTEQWTAE